MAHRLESAVERVDGESPTAEQIEPLLGSFDALQAGFDVLRVAGEQAQEAPLDLGDEISHDEPAAAAASDASAAAGSPADRKSTRLNSSHLVISYAGFCLKNKTQQQTQT